MQAGSAFPATGVVVPSVDVTVDGAPVDVEQISWVRSLPLSAASGVVAGGDLVAATGSMVLSGAALVAAGSDPWSSGAWPPKVGGRVVVRAGCSPSQMYSQFTGRIDRVSGSFGDRSVNAELVDDVDAMRRTFSMASRASFPIGDKPLTALGVLATAARVCGYHSGQALDYSTVRGAASLVAGNTVPEFGATFDYDLGAVLPAPWGSGFARIPALSGTVGNVSLSGRAITYTIDVFFTGSRNPSIHMNVGGLAVGRLTMSETGVYAGHTGTNQWTPTVPLVKNKWYRIVWRTKMGSGGPTNYDLWVIDVKKPPADAGGFIAPNASRAVTPITGTSWGPALATNAGWSIGVTYNGADPFARGVVAAGIVVDVETPPASGREYARTVTGYNAVFEVSNTDAAIYASDTTVLAAYPSLVNRSALEVMKEIAAATLTSMWLDEFGVLRVVGRNALAERKPVLNLSAKTDLLTLGWRADMSAVRRSVQVKYPDYTINARASAGGVTVWSAPDLTFNPGDSWETIIHPEDGVEWIGLDQRSGRSASSLGQEGSQWGTVVDCDGGTITYTITQLDYRSWKVRMVASSGNAGVVTNRVPLNSAAVWLRGTPMPLVRADGILTAGEGSSAVVSAGPSWAADEVFDMGAWGSANSAYAMANFLSARTKAAAPAIDRLEVVPDLRVQLGDAVTVSGVGNGGTLVLSGTVVSIDVSATDGDLTQIIGLLVAAAQYKASTYDEVQSAWTGGTYQALQDQRDGGTYQDDQGNPTARV